MEQSSSWDKKTVEHQFDRLCMIALKGEQAEYYRELERLRSKEICLSEMSLNELNELQYMDEYPAENIHFQVLGYDIDIKNMMLADALAKLTDRKRQVVLLSYFLDMSDAQIARELKLVRETVREHREKSLKAMRKQMEGKTHEAEKM